MGWCGGQSRRRMPASGINPLRGGQPASRQRLMRAGQAQPAPPPPRHDRLRLLPPCPSISLHKRRPPSFLFWTSELRAVATHRADHVNLLLRYFSQRPHLDPVQLGQELAQAQGGASTPAPQGSYGTSRFGAPPPPKGAKPSPFLAAVRPLPHWWRDGADCAQSGGMPPYTRASPAAAPSPSRDSDALGEAEAIYAYVHIHFSRPRLNGALHELIPAYRYPKSETEDLELTKGERVTLIEKVSDDWWRARSQDGLAREGIVPSSYVRVL